MNIFSLLARLLPTSSVDSIVSTLTQIAAQLEAAEAKQIARASDIDAQIASLKDERALVAAEAERAARVRDNINSITA